MFANFLWSSSDYDSFISYLFSKQDKKYQDYQKRLINTRYEIIGVSTAILDDIANDICKGSYLAFLNKVGTTYYEELLIKGFIIAKCGLKEEIFPFLVVTDNWAMCDCFCNRLKFIRNNLLDFLPLIEQNLKSPNEFVVRGCYVLLFNYISCQYMAIILKFIDDNNSDKYYINMACAWLLAECFIKYPNLVYPFLRSNHLSSFVINKTISKIRDSYRVSADVKARLVEFRK